MTLEEIIIERIQQEGPISFKDYMDLCLYHPVHGYYNSQDKKIGKDGDYYTSPCVSPAFGAMISKQLEEIWQQMGCKSFIVVEYGAGNGLLAHDILLYASQNAEFYRNLDYYIIEKSPYMRAEAGKILPSKVKWCQRLKDLGWFSGCIISNELLDNFPVHQIVMQDRLMEVFVGYRDQFTENLVNGNEQLIEYFKELNVFLPYGFRTEVNLDAIEWLNEIGAQLREGCVLTFDYGYLSLELYRHHRSDGTLLCYKDHQVNESPYQDIGKQDMTAFVNFSALHHWGEKFGLVGYGYIDQACFLQRLGFEKYLHQSLNGNPFHYDDSKEKQIKKILLQNLGRHIKVLIQAKNFDANSLTCLQEKKEIGSEMF
ncbi:MAG: hypothetical protein C5B59_18265 [Bacteroidetes bacterium]|nr:MAG: hypothetical protein C5B59_18265 [Bacteroidota bacterium]